MSADTSSAATSRLEERLQQERIAGQKAWGLYIDLMLRVHEVYARDARRRIDELRRKTAA